MRDLLLSIFVCKQDEHDRTRRETKGNERNEKGKENRGRVTHTLLCLEKIPKSLVSCASPEPALQIGWKNTQRESTLADRRRVTTGAEKGTESGRRTEKKQRKMDGFQDKRERKAQTCQ